MKSKIQLEKNVKAKLKDDLKGFFYEERNEEIGDLASEILLDFIIENIGPALYNQGVRDSIKYMTEKVDDLYSLEKY